MFIKRDEVVRAAVIELVEASPQAPPFPGDMLRAPARRLGGKLVVVGAAAAVLIGLTVYFVLPGSSGGRTFVAAGGGRSPRCAPVPPALVKVLSRGVAQRSGRTLMRVWAVESRDPMFEKLFFVSGAIDGASGSAGDSKATWAVPGGLNTVAFGPYSAGTPSGADVNEKVARAQADPLVIPEVALIYSVSPLAMQSSPWRKASGAEGPAISLATEGARLSQTCG